MVSRKKWLFYCLLAAATAYSLRNASSLFRGVYRLSLPERITANTAYGSYQAFASSDEKGRSEGEGNDDWSFVPGPLS